MPIRRFWKKDKTPEKRHSDDGKEFSSSASSSPMSSQNSNTSVNYPTIFPTTSRIQSSQQSNTSQPEAREPVPPRQPRPLFHQQSPPPLLNGYEYATLGGPVTTSEPVRPQPPRVPAKGEPVPSHQFIPSIYQPAPAPPPPASAASPPPLAPYESVVVDRPTASSYTISSQSSQSSVVARSTIEEPVSTRQLRSRTVANAQSTPLPQPAYETASVSAITSRPPVQSPQIPIVTQETQAEFTPTRELRPRTVQRQSHPVPQPVHYASEYTPPPQQTFPQVLQYNITPLPSPPTPPLYIIPPSYHDSTPITAPEPPAILRTPQDHIIAFRFRAATHHAAYKSFTSYINNAIRSSGYHTASRGPQEEYQRKLQEANTLALDYWTLIRNVIDYIHILHPATGESDYPEATLVHGYNLYQLVVKCPFCDNYHIHKTVEPNLGIPLVYPARCSTYRTYRVVFPGDIDALTDLNSDGSQRIGVQLHPTGIFWATVAPGITDVATHFEWNPDRYKKTSRNTSVDMDGLTRKMGEVKIEEKKTFYCIDYPLGEYDIEIEELQRIAQSCVDDMNILHQIVGSQSQPKHHVKAIRWQNSTRTAETEGKHGIQCTAHMDNDTQENLGDLESNGFRTICSCIRGGSYPSLSLVSGIKDYEMMLGQQLPFKPAVLMHYVKALAKEVDHVFPSEIPKSAYWWKREMNYNRNTEPADWFACHTEKKILAAWLVLHTDWIPEGQVHNVLTKKKEKAGPQLGARRGACMTKDMKFWISLRMCDDCRAFLRKVMGKKTLYLDFKEMDVATDVNVDADADGEASTSSLANLS
ncbi:hypothetical protein ABW19_dt0210457 [Dactylella cylindrospora]|nr:hypothetical protein ABW19_dt0210457 [Dactylella cylindrospora]